MDTPYWGLTVTGRPHPALLPPERYWVIVDAATDRGPTCADMIDVPITSGYNRSYANTGKCIHNDVGGGKRYPKGGEGAGTNNVLVKYRRGRRVCRFTRPGIHKQSPSRTSRMRLVFLISNLRLGTTIVPPVPVHLGDSFRAGAFG